MEASYRQGMTDIPIHRFAEVVRARRQSIGMSQRELARHVHSTQGHVGQLERGTHFPGLIKAKQIADALGLEIVIRERKAP